MLAINFYSVCVCVHTCVCACVTFKNISDQKEVLVFVAFLRPLLYSLDKKKKLVLRVRTQM